MRIAAFILITLSLSAQGPSAQAPAAAPASPAPPQSAAATAPAPATMKELMVDLIYPTSDALFYVARGEPKTEAEWLRLELYSLALAESANVLLMPGRAINQDLWRQDTKLLLDVALKAYRSAKARDYTALVELNSDLYESCQSCHEHYRPGYRRRP